MKEYLTNPVTADDSIPVARPPAGDPVPVEWDHDTAGNILIRFTPDTDPDLLAQLTAALLRPRLPDMRWEHDAGVNHVGFNLDLPSGK